MALKMTKRGSLDNETTNEFFCDTFADLANIPASLINLGSVAIVLKGESNGVEAYIANSQKQWRIIFMNNNEGRDDGEDEEKELRIIPKVIGRVPGRPEVNVDLEFKGPKSVIDELDFLTEDYPWPFVEYTDSEENYNLFDVGSDVDSEYDFADEGWLYFEPDDGLDNNNVLHATVLDETGETTLYVALFLLGEDGEGGEKSTCIAKAEPIVTPDVPEDFIFAISTSAGPVKDDDTKTKFGVQLSRSLGLTETIAYGIVDYSVGDTASSVTKATTETEDHGGLIYNVAIVPVNFSSFGADYYAYVLDANDKVLTICKTAGSPFL